MGSATNCWPTMTASFGSSACYVSSCCRRPNRPSQPSLGSALFLRRRSLARPAASHGSAHLQRSPSTMAPHRLATAPAVAIATKHGAIAIIASSALSIWPHGQRFCMIRLRKPIIKAARAEASVMSRRSSGSHDGCLTWSMPCSNQARPTIVRSSSMPSNGAGSRRHTRHAVMRNKASSTPDQGNLTRRSRSSK
jgi:hypothetical protein